MFDNLWVEKYRPQKIDEVVLVDSVKVPILQYLVAKDIPHLLFCGKPGTGKTTLARIICRELQADVLELNASDERGIQVVREKIKKFAMASSLGGLKVIFLDEMDNLTPDSQFALRNIMEKFAVSCRFIATANYLEKIIDPIRSRFQLYNLDEMSVRQVCQVLARILDSEKVTYELEDLMNIVEDAAGDLRVCINAMQSMVVKGGLKYTSFKDKIDIRVLFNLIKDKKWAKIRAMLDGGMDSTYVLTSLFELVYEDVSPEVAVSVVGEYLYRDAIVVNKMLNVLCCIIELGRILS